MEWVSVNDRLPKDNEYVMLTLHRKTMPPRVLPGKYVITCFGIGVFYAAGFRAENVTHWMSIPEAPCKQLLPEGRSFLTPNS